MRLAAVAFAVAAILAVSRARAADPPPLVVHEWGTFTSLQDETGRAIGGINSDDEPVPAFVHRVGIPVNASNQSAFAGSKGIAYINYPPVTMRLETPVIYFHRPAGAAPMTVGVDVAFHGGWLTEFYPNATAQSPGYPSSLLKGDTVGTLAWPKVTIGVGANLPMVQDKVWTTPRQVRTDCISVGGESEQFLFYRGVGHIDAPLRIEQLDSFGRLQVSLSATELEQQGQTRELAELARCPNWLVRVGADGQVDWSGGYSPYHGNTPDHPGLLGTMNGSFLKDHETGLDSLHKDMADSLVKAGLFPDEAEAMLNTWEISYFKSPGLRLFFLVPRSWTDRTLPLHITGDPPITRVMVGRIEIVTPEQRARIRQIESALPADPPTVAESAFELLGRFRAALLVDEQAQRPNSALADFMTRHHIHPD